MPKCVILGIDPGCEITGYGLIRTDGYEHGLVDCGTIRTNRRSAFALRLRTIYQQLITLIQRHKPDQIALEDVFYAVNVKSALRLGHARGVILLAAAHADRPIREYSPLEVKNAVAGYGRADKHQVKKMVQLILALRQPPHSSDAADALAVALCDAFHLTYARLEGSLKG